MKIIITKACSFFFLLGLLFVSCNKEEFPDLIEFPIFNVSGIITLPATNISSNSAVSGADFGNFSDVIIEKGLCWSTSPEPDLNNDIINMGSGSDNFEYTITRLSYATKYYVRVYAMTDSETFYGSEISFKTNEEQVNNYNQYNSISTSNREEYYTNDFSEPTTVWGTYTSNPVGMFHAIYSNSGYEIKNNYSSGRLISGEIDDISQHNFEIEYIFKRINLPYFNSVSFTWGLKNSDPMKFYYLRLSSKYDLSVNIGSVENGENEWVNHTDFDEFSFNKYGENKFTIRRIQNKYYFFINEVFLYEHDFQSFFGDRVGIVMGGPSEAIFKSMKIDYLINL